MAIVPVHSRSVLIVDDDPDDIFFTKRLLVKAGFEGGMLAASGGRQAMAVLEEALAGGPKPGVLLLDLSMPAPDGFAVTRWMRAQKALRDVKIVILTNSDDPSDRRKALEFGADRYLVKNPTAKEIAATVRELLQP